MAPCRCGLEKVERLIEAAARNAGADVPPTATLRRLAALIVSKAGGLALGVRGAERRLERVRVALSEAQPFLVCGGKARKAVQVINGYVRNRDGWEVEWCLKRGEVTVGTVVAQVRRDPVLDLFRTLVDVQRVAGSREEDALRVAGLALSVAVEGIEWDQPTLARHYAAARQGVPKVGRQESRLPDHADSLAGDFKKHGIEVDLPATTRRARGRR